MIREIRNIALEEFQEVYSTEIEKILTYTGIKGNPLAHIEHRHVSITRDMFKGSDNYLEEVLLGDRLLYLIYWRRNEINTINLYIIEA